MSQNRHLNVVESSVVAGILPNCNLMANRKSHHVRPLRSNLVVSYCIQFLKCLPIEKREKGGKPAGWKHELAVTLSANAPTR